MLNKYFTSHANVYFYFSIIIMPEYINNIYEHISNFVSHLVKLTITITFIRTIIWTINAAITKFSNRQALTIVTHPFIVWTVLFFFLMKSSMYNKIYYIWLVFHKIIKQKIGKHTTSFFITFIIWTIIFSITPTNYWYTRFVTTCKFSFRTNSFNFLLNCIPYYHILNFY